MQVDLALLVIGVVFARLAGSCAAACSAPLQLTCAMLYGFF
jgi:hypothetical protein